MQTKSLKLLEIGVDVLSVVKRLGGNELLYLNICDKFLYDESFESIQEAISVHNYDSAEMAIHTLKGVAANLGFIGLQTLCERLLMRLRDANYDAIPKDNQELIEEYHRIIQILKENSSYQ